MVKVVLLLLMARRDLGLQLFEFSLRFALWLGLLFSQEAGAIRNTIYMSADQSSLFLLQFDKH